MSNNYFTSKRGRKTNVERILLLLDESGGLRNEVILETLDLKREEYEKNRKQLEDEKLVERYRTRGGGLKLTAEGIKILPPPPAKSDVTREIDLYEPLIKLLSKSSSTNYTDSFEIDTGSLRRTGRWQNPDVTHITIERYPLLSKRDFVVTTFEVKPFGANEIVGVFEAASHRRFAHESVVVLEWPKKAGEFGSEESRGKAEEIERECRRFGLGLYLITKRTKHQFGLRRVIEPTRHLANDADVEEWLEYVFTLRPAMLEAFKSCLRPGNLTNYFD